MREKHTKNMIFKIVSVKHLIHLVLTHYPFVHSWSRVTLDIRRKRSEE